MRPTVRIQNELRNVAGEAILNIYNTETYDVAGAPSQAPLWKLTALPRSLSCIGRGLADPPKNPQAHPPLGPFEPCQSFLQITLDATGLMLSKRVQYQL